MEEVPLLLMGFESSSPQTCHPERSEGPGFCRSTKQQVLRFAQDDKFYLLLFILKQQGYKVAQVISPDHPGVHAGSFYGYDWNLLGLEPCDEIAIWFD